MLENGNAQLKQYLKPMKKEQRIEFANRCGTTLGNLNQIMYGNTTCGAALAIAIDRESAGNIRCDDLCPSADYQYLRDQKDDEALSA